MSNTLAAMNKGIQRSRLIGANMGNRQKDDFYATPSESTLALLSVEQFDGDILEPACGDGAISRVLEDAGYLVISTDLVDRGYGEAGLDFLMFGYPYRAKNVVTNPPFKMATPFVKRALEHSTEKVAMLLKIGFLEGMERAPLFDCEPFARLWVFRKRQTFLRNGDESIAMNGAGGMIAYGWFIWSHDHKGPPILGWL